MGRSRRATTQTRPSHRCAPPRELNRSRIAEELRRQGSANRGDPSVPRPSRSTVATVVADLQARGRDRERRGRRAVPGAWPAGWHAPPEPVAWGGHRRRLRPRHVRAAVADLFLTVPPSVPPRSTSTRRRSVALDLGADLVERSLAEAGVDRSRAIAAGIGAAGADRSPHRDGGTVRRASQLGWTRGWNRAASRIDRSQARRRRHLGALAEVVFGAGRGLRNVIYVRSRLGSAPARARREDLRRRERDRGRDRPRAREGRRRDCTMWQSRDAADAASTGAIVARLATTYGAERRPMASSSTSQKATSAPTA